MVSFTPFEKAFLTIGSVSLKYYGLMYVIGTILSYFIIKHLLKKRKVNISQEQLWDLMTYGIIGVIAGARIGYILFYNFNYYLSNPLKLFAVWEGGMSFHGGLLGVLLTGYLFSKKHKFKFYELADVVAIPFFLALAFGRIGNFINGELVGRITSLPWGMEFAGYEGFRHPSQLYASIQNLSIFIVLLYLLKYKFKLGTYFWLGISFYGFFRFLVEFVRQPDPQIGFVLYNLTLGQILCLPMVLIGIFMLVRINQKKRSSQ